jgi:2-methylisocitrate lyase-like PEP mutase family enzyme
VGGFAAELADLGIAGINVEDGRPHGSLADPAHHARLVRSAKDAAPELFVNARVDTFWLAGDTPASLADTLTRARAYVDAGADGVFVPGRLEESQIAAVTEAVEVPVNILYLPDLHGVARLAELGVGRISTGSLLYRTALHAAVAAARGFRGDHDSPGGPPSYGEVQAMLGAAPPR